MRLENLNIGEIRFYQQSKSVSERLVSALARWRERARQRAELAHLDPMARKDLGLSDADVWHEARKFPWQS